MFGQTCDGLDVLSQSELLPKLDVDDLVYSENIGAYSNASATWFNGFPPARVVHAQEVIRLPAGLPGGSSVSWNS